MKGMTVGEIRAYERGFDARDHGKPLESNPFLEGERFSKLWIEGWKDRAVQELAHGQSFYDVLCERDRLKAVCVSVGEHLELLLKQAKDVKGDEREQMRIGTLEIDYCEHLLADIEAALAKRAGD